MKNEPTKHADYSFLQGLIKRPVRQVLAACGMGQPVLDSGFGDHSIFTGVFIQALQGEADFNQDGFITAEELNFFVRQRVYGYAKNIVSGYPQYQDLEHPPIRQMI